MRGLRFFALAALAVPAIARISPYDPDDALRPDNVTGLVYEYYNEIGSYYNGTLTIRVHPEYNPPARYSHESDEYLCDEYENRTFDVTMNAMAGFKKPPPASAPHINPFFLDIEVWPMPYELLGSGNENYTNDEAFSITSEMGGDDGPRFKLNMTTTPTNTSGSSVSTTNAEYRFDGDAPPNFLLWNQGFVFNVSGVCSGWERTDDVLYKGSLIRPVDIDNDLVYDWITNTTAPDTAISGSFDGQTAQVEISSAFSALRARDLEIVGRVELIFSGKIDSERSDQLLLGRETPDWNATLGFARGSVAGVEDGASRGVGSLWILGLTGFISLLFII
ncbi:hypothetical protein BJY01DRAFT_250970 [Aspergillus pseudoustus]|uniref:Concanavalin A-like lectin/glucanase domain-containing protein n=1 Tax=Aspergillus pseudoustus TaxID=1810923 RepID=A0ABR4JEK7_9EURO